LATCLPRCQFAVNFQCRLQPAQQQQQQQREEATASSANRIINIQRGLLFGFDSSFHTLRQFGAFNIFYEDCARKKCCILLSARMNQKDWSITNWFWKPKLPDRSSSSL